MLRAVSGRLGRSAWSAAGKRWVATAGEAIHNDNVVGAPGAPFSSGSSSTTSPRVQALVDELVSLNMLEVKALTDSLKDRLGIDDATAMPMMNPAMFAGMGMPGAGVGGAAAAAEEPVVEKTAFDLKLEAFDASKKIAVIKEIRAITGLGLKEAKALVDEAPKVFKSAVAKGEAEEIRDKLKEIGATVALE
jgi:large subunit ribosomal protein L7/L12